MSNKEFPLLHRSEVDCPTEEGTVVLFRDEGNGGLLTAKTSDCTFTVLSVHEVSDSALSKLYKIVDDIVDAASCALGKGLITATEYQSIVDNLNSCVEVHIDPLTGSQQICYSNTPTIFLALSTTDVDCNGASTGTANVDVSGGTAPYTITWTDTAGNPVDETALAAGSYIVTVVDANGKTKAKTFIIDEPAALTGTLSSTDETSSGANDGTATVDVSGGTEPYTYLWDDPSAQTDATATGLAPGDYNVQVTDANGCTDTFGPVTVS